MSDDETADRASSGSPVFPWRGVLLGPGLIRHECTPGTDGHGVCVLGCVVCARLFVRMVEQLVRPAFQDEMAAVVGWVTSCGHVVWAGDWELVYPGLGRAPRWEDRRIPQAERDAARYAAFAQGEQ